MNLFLTLCLLILGGNSLYSSLTHCTLESQQAVVHAPNSAHLLLRYGGQVTATLYPWGQLHAQHVTLFLHQQSSGNAARCKRITARHGTLHSGKTLITAKHFVFYPEHSILLARTNVRLSTTTAHRSGMLQSSTCGSTALLNLRTGAIRIWNPVPSPLITKLSYAKNPPPSP